MSMFCPIHKCLLKAGTRECPACNSSAKKPKRKNKKASVESEVENKFEDVTEGIEDIPKDYVIHHINSDKTDNRLENLQCMPEIEHLKLHDKMRERDDRGRFL